MGYAEGLLSTPCPLRPTSRPSTGRCWRGGTTETLAVSPSCSPRMGASSASTAVASRHPPRSLSTSGRSSRIISRRPMSPRCERWTTRSELGAPARRRGHGSSGQGRHQSGRQRRAGAGGRRDGPRLADRALSEHSGGVHGRPEAAEALTAELRSVLSSHGFGGLPTAG